MFNAPLLTTAAVAEFCSISERTLKEHRAHGTGPTYVRIGRLIRYRPEDLEIWLSANLNQPIREVSA